MNQIVAETGLRFFRPVFALLFFLCFGISAQAATISVVDRGWFRDDCERPRCI